jgi:hypothetical protein
VLKRIFYATNVWSKRGFKKSSNVQLRAHFFIIAPCPSTTIFIRFAVDATSFSEPGKGANVKPKEARKLVIGTPCSKRGTPEWGLKEEVQNSNVRTRNA